MHACLLLYVDTHLYSTFPFSRCLILYNYIWNFIENIFLVLSIASQMVVDGRCSPNAPFGAAKAAPAKKNTPVYMIDTYIYTHGKTTVTLAACMRVEA